MHGSIISIISAILLGLSLGYILQRGRFCLNSAFRDIIFLDNLTTFRAYLLSVVVAIVGSNLIQDLGFMVTANPQTGELVHTALLRQNFVPLANILGGFLFGLGIVLAGGCASGIVFRLGEGQAAAIIAIIGFFFGVVMTTDGVFSHLHHYLKGFTFEIGGIKNPAFWDIFGQGPMVKWVSIAVFSIVLLAFVFKGKPKFGLTKTKTFTWALTGLFIGVLTIFGWWMSSYFGGFPRGLAITTPMRELFNSLLYNSSHSPFQEFSFLGIFRGTWGVFFIFSVPLGAFLSAKARKEFMWKIPPVGQFLTVLGGSVMMGVGAVIAGGCNLGHGITGVSTGAISSIIAITAIVMGNWTMSYFKFIRPTNNF
jgi:uncharacterized membrane protein YedE/YeeE